MTDPTLSPGSVTVEGQVFMNNEGQYLRVRERRTHTGRHFDISFTSTLSEADVFTVGEQFAWRQHVDFSKYIPVHAKMQTVRIVTLVKVEHDQN